LQLKSSLKKNGTTPYEQQIEPVGEPICPICSTDIRFLAICPKCGYVVKIG